MNVIPYSEGGAFGNCKVCGAVCVTVAHHRCAPVCLVRWADEPADCAREVHARDAEEAAESYCDQFDSDFDYAIIRNRGATLIVQCDGHEVTVHVEAESRPHYSATVAEDELGGPSPDGEGMR